MELPPQYYENLGGIPEVRRLSGLDIYRFEKISKEVIGDEVLDIGAYYGDFLRICRDDRKIGRIFGTEVNNLRVKTANRLLGDEVVVEDFQHGRLSQFDDQSVDTVVCMEVLEHIEDDNYGFQELLRVAKKRAIITVPYKESVRETVCVNCGKATPQDGHLHAMYDESSFLNLMPQTFIRSKIEVFGSPVTRFMSNYLPNRVLPAADRLFCKLFPADTIWVMFIFDRKIC